ncbi:hypothetical protein T440DRAFT_436175, partial [Plenodomus tracheiphilus IPT5]
MYLYAVIDEFDEDVATVIKFPNAFDHKEKIFPGSYMFSPERWTVSKSNPVEKFAVLRKYFDPFSLGTRF